MTWLEEELKKRDMSYSELGRRVGVHYSSVSNWCKGVFNISPERKKQILKALEKDKLKTTESQIRMIESPIEFDGKVNGCERCPMGLEKCRERINSGLPMFCEDVREDEFALAVAQGWADELIWWMRLPENVKVECLFPEEE